MPIAKVVTNIVVPLEARIASFNILLSRLQPVPAEWLTAEARARNGDMECVACNDFNTLKNAWRKALKWTEGLDTALSVMLASIISTPTIGDQLWIKIIGPPACGKSTLCEAVSINYRHVLAKSTIRGFMSGWRKVGGKDTSLVAQANGKALVTKDGDTLLQSPNLSQILSEARDIYDGSSRTHYRNAESSEYSGLRMVWILCGTSSLRALDSSELGERFLDCVVMEDIDEDLEDEISKRVAFRTFNNRGVKCDGDASTNYEAELATAMQLTGGYIDYLVANADTLIQSVGAEDKTLMEIDRLGKFVSFMRAKPKKDALDKAERELSSRLVSQHVRLATCLAAVLNKTSLDAEVMRRVRKVAFDTSRGLSLELVKHLTKPGEHGLEIKQLGVLMGKADGHVRTHLRFLQELKVVESYIAAPTIQGRNQVIRYRLNPKMAKLVSDVNYF